MKKLLFLIPIVLLLMAACASAPEEEPETVEEPALEIPSEEEPEKPVSEYQQTAETALEEAKDAREKANSFKAAKAVPDLYEKGEEFILQGQADATEEDYLSATENYQQAKVTFEEAAEKAEERRKEAQQALKEAEEAISNVEKSAEEAEAEAAEGGEDNE